MKTGRIKIGQIGMGHEHAEAKMATLKKLPGEFEIVGIAEPDIRWQERKGHLPGYRGVPVMSVDELLKTPGLKAVMVETDVMDLMPAASLCVQAGMHIHLDKPAGADNPPGKCLENFRLLLEKASARGLAVQMGYMFRNNPAVQFALNAAREGLPGRIFEMHCVMSRMDGMDGPDYRARVSRFRGGAMYIFGCHLIDLVVAVMGKPEKVTPYLRRTWPEKDGLYDNGLAVLEYRHATATVRTALVEIDGMRRRQLVICGDEGTIEIYPIEPPGIHSASRENPCPMPEPGLTLSRERGRFHAGFQKVSMPSVPGRYDEQLTEFARIIRGEIENPYSIEHDMAVQETTLLASGWAV